MKLTSSVLCLALLSTSTVALAQSSPVKGQITIIQEVEVPAQETGVIGKVLVKPGQRVTRGEKLGSLDDVDALLDLKRAKIEVQIAEQKSKSGIHVKLAQKGHLVALAELRRGEEAIEKYAKALSITEMDRLRFMAEQAELAIEQAQELQGLARLDLDLKKHEVAVAERKVQRHQFVSPLIGVVADVNHEEAEFVETGTPVFRVLRLDRLRFESRVSVTRAQAMKVGQPIVINVQLEDGKTADLKAELTYISHEVDKIKRDVKIAAEFDNSKLIIKAGMRATLKSTSTE